MAKKKAKSKTQAKDTVEKKNKAEQKSKKGDKKVDLVAVRKSIVVMVTDAVEGITQAAVDDAKKGQLATVKYLFEITGVYPPASDELGMKLEDDSLAKILLERMNIAIAPLTSREDDEETFPKAAAVEEPGRDEERRGVQDTPVAD
jgi:hypothetical protein